MELNRPEEVSRNDYGLAMASLKDALPHYPPKLQPRIDHLIDGIAYHRARALDALEEENYELFHVEADVADHLQTCHDWEAGRQRRRDRVRWVAEKFKGLLPLRIHNANINLPIGPFDL